MLKTRIIPTMLMKDTTLVKGVAFDSWRRVGTVMPSLKVYNRRRVDELIVLDIAATPGQRALDFEEVSLFSAECFVPLTVGGGIKTIDDIRQTLRAGADKVAINSAAYDNPELIEEAAGTFGSQCVVVSIDAKRDNGSWVCCADCGTTPKDISPAEWSHEAASRGAGEILITSIDQDGTMEGYDTELIRTVVDSVDIPIIASGGAGNFEHMRQAIQEAGAQAVSAASIFHFTQQTPLEAKDYLAKHGIPVRDINRQQPLTSHV